MAFNLVEMVADQDESAFDQPCKFGHRVDSHAVYCHNDEWKDGPRKCRRTWYTGGETKDEDCPGFQPNPEFKGVLNPTPLAGPPCTKCCGSKLTKLSDDKIETCSRCMGGGAEPHAMALDQYEQDTLELAYTTAKTPRERFNRIAETKAQSDSINKLSEHELVVVRSVSWAKDVTVYLLESTEKGHTVMKANWEARKAQR